MNGKIAAVALWIVLTVSILYVRNTPLALDEIEVYLTTIAAFPIAFGVIFSIFLVFAPGRLLIGADAEIDCLRSIVNRRDEIQDILLNLARLRESGIVLRNKVISDSEFPGWLKHYNDWNNSVTATSSRLSAVEGKLIEVLGELTKGIPHGLRILQGLNNQEHGRAVAILTEKTNRIHDLVSKYADLITRLNLVDVDRVRNFLQDFGSRP